MKVKHISPNTIIVLNFASVIIVGGILLFLPISIKGQGHISFVDALYISTSAICVTGLSPLSLSTTFSPFGKIVIALLMQIGGLGITVISTLFIIAIGKKVDIRNRNIVRETLNFESGKGVVHFVKDVFITTITFEVAGAIIFFFIFIKDFGALESIGLSVFHAISAFNNAGFDILYTNSSLVMYQNNVLFNLITALLIIFGGIGFLVIREIVYKKWHFKRYSMHTKIALSMSAALIIIGMIAIKCQENISWLGAFFLSVSSRTAGFYTYSLRSFVISTNLILCFLMFIGASPGSTGGGIKTTTLFVLFAGVKEFITGKKSQTFHFSLPKNVFKKACVILILSLTVVFTGTFLMLIFDRDLTLIEALFEITSAFATVGLTLDVTPLLSNGSKILCMMMMFIGRLGPLTITSLGAHSGISEDVYYPEGNISIG